MIESLQLDKLIEQLEEMVNTAARPIIGDTSKEQWDDIFELMPQIQDHFKTVRYPQKFDRDEAWVKFNNIRNNAFESKNSQYKVKSKTHYNEIWSRLEDADYNWRIDSLAKVVLWGEFKVSIETMKERGKMLKEAGIYFKENKMEMTKEHKAEIHEKFIEVRESHDVFWDRVKEYREEQNKIYEDKKQAWEEKQLKSQEIKERMIANREKLKINLNKSEDFLSSLESQKSNLEDKISSAYSDNFREKHEGWLSEVEDKIREVEEQIEKFKTWIQEIDDKLDNWT